MTIEDGVVCLEPDDWNITAYDTTVTCPCCGKSNVVYESYMYPMGATLKRKCEYCGKEFEIWTDEEY